MGNINCTLTFKYYQEKSKCEICLFKYRNNNTFAFNELL